MGKVIGRFGKTCGGCNCNNATEPATQPDTEDLPCLECDSTDEVPCRYAVIFQCGLTWPLEVREGETTRAFGFTEGQASQIPMTYPVVELKKDCICGHIYSQRGYGGGDGVITNGGDTTHSILIDSNLIEDLDTDLPFWKFPPYALTGDPPKIDYRGAKWQRKYENGLGLVNFEVSCLNRTVNKCFYIEEGLTLPDLSEPLGLKLWNLDIKSDPPKLVWGDFGGLGSVFPDDTTYNDMMAALGRNLPIYVADGMWNVWGQNSLTLQNPGDWINLPRQVCVVPVDQRESRTSPFEGPVPRFNLNKHCVDRQSSCKCCDNGVNAECLILRSCGFPRPAVPLFRTSQEGGVFGETDNGFPEHLTWPSSATPCYVFLGTEPADLYGGPILVIYCDGETYRLDVWCYDEDEEEWVLVVDGLEADIAECTCQQMVFGFPEVSIPCCPNDIETCCCDEPIPANLTLSDGVNSISLEYDEEEGGWVGSGTLAECDGENLQWILKCDGAPPAECNWVATKITDSRTVVATATSAQCDPLELTFSGDFCNEEGFPLIVTL